MVGENLRFLWKLLFISETIQVGPRLLWITDRKSQVANGSMSVPVTLNDLERQDMRDPDH